MTKENWKTQITNDCKSLGTYKPEFDTVIDTLASTLEKRDEADVFYQEQGAVPVIDFNGGKTKGLNPALKVWNDLNMAALKYWEQLGLTPSGFKKLTGTIEESEGDSFDEFLNAFKKHKELQADSN